MRRGGGGGVLRKIQATALMFYITNNSIQFGFNVHIQSKVL